MESRRTGHMEAQELGMAMVAAPADSAQGIARAIVERRLAACAQVTADVTSLYWWKGQLENATERLILLKTERSRIPSIRDLLKALHPYEVPELIFLPIAAGSADYLAWLSDEMGRRE